MQLSAVTQTKAIARASGMDVRDKQIRAGRASTGGWFLVDEVVRKHEYIPFALALDENGAVKGSRFWSIARLREARFAMRTGESNSLARRRE
jgi:hypothetical protein